MKSLLAGLKKLPALFKKHWRKILFFTILSLSWKVVAIIYRHHIIDFIINFWIWLRNINPWWRPLIVCVFCAILFLGLLRLETQMEKEEDK